MHIFIIVFFSILIPHPIDIVLSFLRFLLLRMSSHLTHILHNLGLFSRILAPLQTPERFLTESMSDGLGALKHFKRWRFVHRDIGPGNLLIKKSEATPGRLVFKDCLNRYKSYRHQRMLLPGLPPRAAGVCLYR